MEGCVMGDAVDAAGHAQVEHEGGVGIGGECEEEFFAVAVDAGEVKADEGMEGGVLGSEEIFAEEGDGADFLVEEERLKGAADFIDFGEFGHAGRVKAMA